MSEYERDLAWEMERLERTHQKYRAAVAAFIGVTLPPVVSVWDVNDPETLNRVIDGFELQMLGVKP